MAVELHRVRGVELVQMKVVHQQVDPKANKLKHNLGLAKIHSFKVQYIRFLLKY